MFPWFYSAWKLKVCFGKRLGKCCGVLFMGKRVHNPHLKQKYDPLIDSTNRLVHKKYLIKSKFSNTLQRHHSLFYVIIGLHSAWTNGYTYMLKLIPWPKVPVSKVGIFLKLFFPLITVFALRRFPFKFGWYINNITNILYFILKKKIENYCKF